MLFMVGAQIAYAERRDTVLNDARELKPTLIYGVPRFFEKIYAQILNNAIRGPALQKNLF